MLSNIIKAQLAEAAILGLTDRINLFAEHATGDQYVLVLENAVNSPHEPIEAIRESGMQVLVVGWNMLDAKFKAEKIYDLVGAIMGTYTFADTGNGATETYAVKSVTRKPPIRLRWKGKSDFSINFTLHYIFSVA